VNRQTRRTSAERGTVAWPPLSRQSARDAALWAWRSRRLFSIVLLAVAVLLGAHYRFHKLERWDMDADEAITWAVVVEPNVCEVVGKFWQIEYGGKLPVYDFVLRQWMRIFGAGLFAMRAMSAALGTVVMVLLFFAVREICGSLGDEPVAALGEMAGAFGALIYAVNVTLVIADRRAREFPLLVAAELLQIIFFMRAQRRGVFDDYLGLVIFTAIMLPINYSASFLLLAEALWLGCLLAAKWAGSARARRLAVFGPGFGVVAGVALLAPFASDAYVSSRDAVAGGAVDFMKLQPISWPFTVLCQVFHDPALFWVVVASIALGVWRQWGLARLAPGFLAVWTVGPLLAALAVSYLIRPIEIPRYVIVAFVGLFAFAGFGAACVRSTAVRILLAITIVALSAPTLHRSLRASRNGDWRKATALAVKYISPGKQIAVFLPYSQQVVKFYLPPERRTAAVAMDTNATETRCGTAPVLIFQDETRAPPAQIAAVKACYPRVVAKLNLIEVRGR
jgi:Dolichyl-phosphate-mannose-protein mannosyltransferase